MREDFAKHKEVVVEVNGQPNDDEFPMSDDELKIINTSSNEDIDGGKERVNWPEFNEKTDMEDPKFELGMLFSTHK